MPVWVPLASRPFYRESKRYMQLKIRPEYADIYCVDLGSLPMPSAGESIREYVLRSGLGKEEDILAVVNGRARHWDYRFSETDIVEIYPMAASG